MAKGLNKCMFIGNATKDAEIRYLANGDAVASFSVAVNDDYKDKQGNKIEQCEFVNIVAFRRLAEIMGEYVKKGKKVYIEGKQKTRKWQDQNGQDRWTTEIVASDMLLIDGNRSDDSAPPDAHAVSYNAQAPSAQGGFDDEQIPFCCVMNCHAI